MFLTNLGVLLFCKNHNTNPQERTSNLAERTEKPIKTHCKPCKNRLINFILKIIKWLIYSYVSEPSILLLHNRVPIDAFHKLSHGAECNMKNISRVSHIFRLIS